MTTIPLPAAVVVDDRVSAVFRHAVDFIGPDGVRHPAAAWLLWDADEWSRMCPGWQVLPLVDARPQTAVWQVAHPRPTTDWAIGPNSVTVTYDVAAMPLEERRAALMAAVSAEVQRRLRAGMPYQGKVIQMDDASRNALTSLAAVASTCMAGGGTWSAAYSAGWITADNSRLSLPEPADGLALALAAGNWYAGLVQAARTIKDAIAASASPETVDMAAAWPAETA